MFSPRPAATTALAMTPDISAEKSNARKWLALALIVPALAWALAAWLEPEFDYNRWDNYQYHTPSITDAHARWLAGEFPHLNPHQNLGEPIFGTMQPAALYAPYTALLLVAKTLGIERYHFPALSTFFHMLFGAAGWFFLGRRAGLRPPIAFLIAVSASLGGFFHIVGSNWLPITSTMAWLPWLLFLTINFLSDPRSPFRAALLAAALTMIMFIGHPQFALYTWLFVALFGVLFSGIMLRNFRPLLPLAASAIIAGFLSAPYLLPALDFLSTTPRQQAMPKDIFLGRSVPPWAFIDMLLPVYSYDNYFFIGGTSILLHLGSWMPVAILCGAVQAWQKPAATESPALQTDHAALDLRRFFWTIAALTGAFMILSFGKYGLVQPLTYGIPVWSSMREPFKFLPVVLTGVTLLGGIGLELLCRNTSARGGALRIGAALGALALLLLLLNHMQTFGSPLQSLTQVSGWISLVAGIILIVLTTQMASPRAATIVLALAPLQLLGALMIGHHTAIGSYHALPGKVDLPVEAGYRVLPLSFYEYTLNVPQDSYGVLHAATMNHFDCATGFHPPGMMPKYYFDVLPTDLRGLMPPQLNAYLLGSPLLRSLNVRYIIVGKADPQRSTVAAHPAYRKLGEASQTVVFEDKLALPRAYFAAEALPLGTQALWKNLVETKNAKPVALVDGLREQKTFGSAEIRSIEWKSSSMRCQVDAKAPAFLVVSMLYSSGWTAAIDGQFVLVRRVNSTILGIDVPPGKHEIQFEYITPGFWNGVAIAAFGVVIMLIWILVAQRRKQRA